MKEQLLIKSYIKGLHQGLQDAYLHGYIENEHFIFDEARIPILRNDMGSLVMHCREQDVYVASPSQDKAIKELAAEAIEYLQKCIERDDVPNRDDVDDLADRYIWIAEYRGVAMAEFIGVKDPIGNGLSNMYLTDEEIIRCSNCGYSEEANDRLDCVENKCSRRETDPNGFCYRAVRKDD